MRTFIPSILYFSAVLAEFEWESNEEVVERMRKLIIPFKLMKVASLGSDNSCRRNKAGMPVL